MSNVYGILFGDVHYEEIAERIRKGYGLDVEVRTRDVADGYVQLVFEEIGERPPGSASHRQLWVWANGRISDYLDVFDGDRTLVNLGAWGSGLSIITDLVEAYGGFVRPYDDAQWIRYRGHPQMLADLSPETKLKADLAAVVPPQEAVILSHLIDNPEALDRVLDAYSSYRATRGGAIELSVEWERVGTIERDPPYAVWKYTDDDGREVFNVTRGAAPSSNGGYHDLDSLLSLKNLRRREIIPATSFDPQPPAPRF